MVSLLLPVIYLAFISLGLPDSLLGSAWPVMYQELGTSVSSAGIISMIIAAGTIVSSLNSDRLNTRFGTGKITAVSVLTTAVALFGFSVSHSFLALCLWGIPYGLGAGSVDAALNNYVALHYKARHMSWLHCMWGVGCSTGPVVMGYAINHSTWNNGYRTIALFQIVLTLILFFSLPLWQKPSADASADENSVPEQRSFSRLIRVPGVKEVLTCFFCYCAVESTAGMWAASYCTLFRGIDAKRAASWASLFHSPMMEAASQGLTEALEGVGFMELKIPYVTNVTGQYVRDTALTRGLLIQQVASGVRWQQSIEAMIADGVDTFVEIGPGRTLTGFLRKINRDVKGYNIRTYEEMHQVCETLL